MGRQTLTAPLACERDSRPAQYRYNCCPLSRSMLMVSFRVGSVMLLFLLVNLVTVKNTLLHAATGYNTCETSFQNFLKTNDSYFIFLNEI